MRIEFERSGGFMGLRQTVVLDTSNLEPQEADELQELVDTAGFFDLPEQIVSRSVQEDGFQYRLTIEEFDNKHSVILSDTSTPESLQPLVQRLNLMARSRRRGRPRD
jgi:hypothetical protein